MPLLVVLGSFAECIDQSNYSSPSLATCRLLVLTWQFLHCSDLETGIDKVCQGEIGKRVWNSTIVSGYSTHLDPVGK